MLVLSVQECLSWHRLKFQYAFSTLASFLPLFKDITEKFINWWNVGVLLWLDGVFFLPLFSPLWHQFKPVIPQHSPRFLPCLILCMLVEVLWSMLPSDVEILPLRSLLPVIPRGDNCYLKFFIIVRSLLGGLLKAMTSIFYLCVVPQHHRLCSDNLLDAIRSSCVLLKQVQIGQEFRVEDVSRISVSTKPGSLTKQILVEPDCQDHRVFTWRLHTRLRMRGRSSAKNKLVLHMCWLWRNSWDWSQWCF